MGAKIKEPVKTAWHRQKKKKRIKTTFSLKETPKKNREQSITLTKKKKFNVFLASSHS